jgi:subtilisin family serine protease
MHYKTRATRRVFVTLTAAVGLATSALVAPTLVTAAPVRTADAQPAKIESILSASLAKGSADFWVRFTARADTSAAKQMTDWDARGQYVYDTLTKTATSSQASVRAFLDTQSASYESFWAVNAILVKAGSASLASSLSSFTSVSTIVAPRETQLIAPVAGVDEATAPDGVEWGIANVKADKVWSQFGDKGKGIVVAAIDTGAQYNHPALVNQYRGKKKGGKFNHNYNWFDSVGSSQAPYDNNGHGTHTMGTMVGDDGGANQIGMAPKAKWIQTNGCCASEGSLIASGQWLLAPTNLKKQNPKPGKRPDIVNNSWGYTAPGQNPLFDEIIADWDDAGIFGMWANGNLGPSCSTSAAPGSRPFAYSAGAYDINNTIASFSSRGPGLGSDIKPNLSAPGVNVRSAAPGSGYQSLSGTSMATPHIAGAIALLWSAAKSLKGDVDATKKALDNSGIDVDNSQCGGNKDDNNVFGEGRLDALALVSAAAAKGLVPARQ